MNLSKILLPFGTASTSMLILNIIMYCIVIFLAVFLPVYFLIIKSTSNNNNYVLSKEQMIANSQSRLASLQEQITRTESTINTLSNKTNLNVNETNQLAALRLQLNVLKNDYSKEQSNLMMLTAS